MNILGKRALLIFVISASALAQQMKTDCPDMAFKCAASQGKIVALQCIRSIPRLDQNNSWFCDSNIDLSKVGCDVHETELDTKSGSLKVARCVLCKQGTIDVSVKGIGHEFTENVSFCAASSQQGMVAAVIEYVDGVNKYNHVTVCDQGVPSMNYSQCLSFIQGLQLTQGMPFDAKTCQWGMRELDSGKLRCANCKPGYSLKKTENEDTGVVTYECVTTPVTIEGCKVFEDTDSCLECKMNEGYRAKNTRTECIKF